MRKKHACFFSKTAILTQANLFKLGRDCAIHDYTIIDPQGGAVVFGKNCTLNSFSTIYGKGGVEIGDNTRIASHTSIIASSHNYNSKNTPIYKQGVSAKGIIIGKDVWIGSGVKILDGSLVGDGCVIGANSVVKGNLEPYNVYAGALAKKIGRRH